MPDGTIILLDDLVKLIGDDQQILAVLAHELGHAHGRHGLQLLLQSSAVGAFLTFYIGDISHLLAAAPAAVVQAKYSQSLERQADDYGAALLLNNGMSPALLADALKKLTESHPGISMGSYLSNHPSTDERMRHLRLLHSRPDSLPRRPLFKVPQPLNDPYHLQRFVDAQRGVYAQVETELRAGRKESHWMWFIFPQIKGLGRSSMAQKYAIATLAEATAYLNHPLLGRRLRTAGTRHVASQVIEDIRYPII
jgi:hypothetical protein